MQTGVTSTMAFRHRTARFRSRLLCLGLALALTAGVAGCSSIPGVAASKPPLRIGYTPNYPPIVYRDEDGVIGVEAELGDMLAAELARRPRWVELEWAELIPSLERGEIDIVMSGMSITPARSERVLFSEPYLRVGQLGLIRRSDLARFGHPGAIRRRGARVGYVNGTTGEDLVRRQLSSSESYAFGDADSGVRSLRAHRIDFFIHDAPTVWRVTMGAEGADLVGLFRPLTEEYLAWAVAPDNVELKQQLDAALESWRASHRLDPILNRWIPVRVQIGP